MMSKLQLKLEQKETKKEFKLEEHTVRHIMIQTDTILDEVCQ